METIALSAEDLQKSRKKADMEIALQSLIGVIPDVRLSLENYRTESLNRMESSCSKDELVRNAMVIYPYITDLSISHGKAAEILGIRKHELIELYDELGLSYLDQDIRKIEQEVSYWRSLKEAKYDRM